MEDVPIMNLTLCSGEHGMFNTSSTATSSPDRVSSFLLFDLLQINQVSMSSRPLLERDSVVCLQLHVVSCLYYQKRYCGELLQQAYTAPYEAWNGISAVKLCPQFIDQICK